MPNDRASSRLRGAAISNALGFDNSRQADVVVFVKGADCASVEEAHSAGCRIVYDPIDRFSFSERHQPDPWFGLVNTVIVYSVEQSHWYIERDLFPSAQYVIIPHQWDKVLDGAWCPKDRLRVGYIGHSFNMPHAIRDLMLPRVTNINAMMSWAGVFNCHIDSLRAPGSLDAIHKPATKISTAAAVGAAIITTRTAAAVELLGDDYPLYVDSGKELANAIETARGMLLSGGLPELSGVRLRTSLDEVAKLYRDL